MVLPAKIFEIKEEANLGLIIGKLKDFHEEELYQTENGKTINLVGGFGPETGWRRGIWSFQ